MKPCSLPHLCKCTHTVMSDAVSVSIFSDPQSPLGRTGVNVYINCAAILSAIIDTSVIVQIQVLDPAGRQLTTETSNSSSSFRTTRALVSSFKDHYAGNYMCTVTLTTPASQRITKFETTHIYVGKMFYTPPHIFYTTENPEFPTYCYSVKKFVC